MGVGGSTIIQTLIIDTPHGYGYSGSIIVPARAGHMTLTQWAGGASGSATGALQCMGGGSCAVNQLASYVVAPGDTFSWFRGKGGASVNAPPNTAGISGTNSLCSGTVTGGTLNFRTAGGLQGTLTAPGMGGLAGTGGTTNIAGNAGTPTTGGTAVTFMGYTYGAGGAGIGNDNVNGSTPGGDGALIVQFYP
jgi:hypothetical protein